MKTRTRLKLRKLVLRPGEFARDYLIKRYPWDNVPMEPRKPQKRKSKSATPRAFDLASNHHLRDPFQTNIPIDVVITWVDGSDPDWQRRKSLAMTGLKVDSISDDFARFQSKDELRYCLRSILAYAPWVNHIYIVTDRQRPSWLGEDPRISVVDHSQIVPPEYLPTYNSHVIETWLHRIPSLAEHFIYLNDDVMLARPTPANYYFASNGLASNFITQAETPDGAPNRYDTPTQRGAKNVRQLLMREFGVYLRYNYAHTVFPLRRSTYEAAHAMFAPEIARYCGNKVRGETDLPFSTFLIPNLAYLRAEATTQRTVCFYFDIRSTLAKSYFRLLLDRRGKETAPFSMCLNDVAADCSTLTAEQQLTAFMESYFPIPAAWETDMRDDSQAARNAPPRRQSRPTVVSSLRPIDLRCSDAVVPTLAVQRRVNVS